MSIFSKHKNGVPPTRQTDAPREADGGQDKRFADALAREDWYSAYRFYRENRQVLAGHADAVYPLARYLVAENHPDEALALLQGFASRHPHHADVVKNYVLAAEVMRRDFADHEGARALLQRLAASYAEHPDYPLIEAQLKNQEGL